MASSSSNLLLTIRSSDGQEFTIPKSAATSSITIKNMLEEGFGDSIIPIPNVDSKNLAEIVTYLKEHDSDISDEKRKEFDEEFLRDRDIRDLFDIILAANFLHIKDLMDKACQKVADRIKNKSVKYIRKLFNITNDFTPEEEEDLRNEYFWAWEGVDPDDDDDETDAKPAGDSLSG